MLKVSSLLLSEVTKGVYNLSLSNSSDDALAITASGSLLPYNQHKHLSQHRYSPSTMMVDELSLMSDRVRRMMDEEASATLKKSDKLYSGPLTSNTTIYPGSTAYLNLLSGRGNFQEKNDKMTHAEVASRAAAFLFDVPSLKLDTSSRRGFKNFLDSTPIFRKRTVDSSDDGYLKEAGCFESSSWKTPDAFNVVSSREATNDTTSESSSNQHPHILRTTSNVKIYFQ